MNYFIQNVGQIDLFITVSKYFHYGMDYNSAPIAGRHTKKYSKIFPLWSEEEVPQLGRGKRWMEFSIRKCLIGDYFWPLRD